MNVLVTGAAGFIGGHLCRFLKKRGHWVRGVDRVGPRYGELDVDEFLQLDLREPEAAIQAMHGCQWAFFLAADMGGMGFISRADKQATIFCDNALINLNCALAAGENALERVFYASSACVYPESLQLDTVAQHLQESDAYPAEPDTEYGWEKLMSEHTYLLRAAQFGYDIRIARFHNVYGPYGSWNDGREKAPAALCRKAAEAKQSGNHELEIWGDGQQTRSFCYIDDALEMIWRLMCVVGAHAEPLNIGTDRAVSIDELALIAAQAAGIDVTLRHDLSKPQGVRGRNADLSKMREVLGDIPSTSLEDGIAITYDWIEEQLAQA